MIKRILPAALVVAAIAGFAAGSAQAAPEPKFEVVSKDGPIEVRRYPAMAAAEVTVSGERDSAANSAFQPLFRYISGDNAGAAKIAMTAPVTQGATQAKGKGEKIEMTAPVTQAKSATGGDWAVRFILPAAYTAETAPRPTNPNVRIAAIPAQTVAVIRFSGVAREKPLAERTAELQRYLAAHRLTATGPATYAFYDAPWTPGFMRRNEVMIPVGD